MGDRDSSSHGNAVIQFLTPALLAGLTLMLSMEGPAGCPLDHADVYAFPPSTFRVLVTRQCGTLICWERWIETDGKRAHYSMLCDTVGQGLSVTTPAPAAPQIHP